MMDSQIFRKAANRLPALARIAVLRFNTRGTSSAHGTSEGEFDAAVGEQYDVAAAIEYAEFAELPNIWVVGWSFGTDLALMYGGDPGIVGAILLSPPLRFADEAHLRAWDESGRSLVAIIPEYDDYLRPAEARERFAAAPHCEVIPVPDGKHLWVGQAETVLNLIVQHLNPEAAPLPETWDGPMEHERPQIVSE
jgi:alpha/beta superfamily hydrolase